jgi:RNA polymerase sigma factor (sigma-70 family)
MYQSGSAGRPVLQASLKSDDRAADGMSLLRDMCNGDHHAERIFVQRYSAVVRWAVRSVLRSHGVIASPEDIEDLVGEVWVSLLEEHRRRLRLYDPARRTKLSTWIGMLARNKTIDVLRAAKNPIMSPSVVSLSEPCQTETLSSKALMPTEQLERAEQSQIAIEAMQRLSLEEQRFLKARYVYAKTTEELARQFGIAAATVYSRSFKIIEKLARAVSQIDEPESEQTPYLN